MTNVEPDAPDPIFHVSWQVTPAGVVVAVSGDIDLETAPELNSTLEDAAGHVTPAVPLALDLSEVRFLGSAAMGVLLKWHRHCAAHGTSFVVVAAPPGVRRVLGITGLDAVLTLVPELSTE